MVKVIYLACLAVSNNNNNNNNNNNKIIKWSKNFDERPHRRLVTPGGGECVRPSIANNALMRAYVRYNGQHMSPLKSAPYCGHLDPHLI